MTTTIGIIGAGGIGQAFAGHMANAGYDVILSNSRGPDSLTEAVKRIGARARAGTREQAAQSDIVFLAVPWAEVPSVLSDLPPWNNRILIDATNPVLQPGFRLAELGGRNSSQMVAAAAPGARVVKTANTLLRAVLASDPRQNGGQRVLFVSGDDSAANAIVSQMLQKAGFAVIDLGRLTVGGYLQQFPGGPLATLNLIKLGYPAMKRLIALLVAVLSIAASAQERSAVANNVALWYDAFHKNDPSLLDKILAEQWVDIPPAPGQPPGPQGAKQILTELRTAFPDLTIEIRDVVEQGNKVVVRSEIAGTQGGPFLGRAPKGRKMVIQAIDIHEFQNGKIVRTWHTEDWMSGLHQLGILE